MASAMKAIIIIIVLDKVHLLSFGQDRKVVNTHTVSFWMERRFLICFGTFATSVKLEHLRHVLNAPLVIRFCPANKLKLLAQLH